MASIFLLDLYPLCNDDSPFHMGLDPDVVVYNSDKTDPSISLGIIVMRYLYHLTNFGSYGGRESALSRQFLQIRYRNLTKKIMSHIHILQT